jgi:hypothetical protein
MRPFIAAIVLCATAGTAAAGAPQKKNVNSYSPLWLSSPFTTKPPPAERGPEVSAFDDWALGGVSEIDGGYMITLLHKKNAGDTQIIRPSGTRVITKGEMKHLPPGDPTAFKVERVEFGKSSWKETTVQLSSGGRTGSVKFDDKLLTPTASAAPAQGRPPGQPGQPVLPGQPGAQNPPGVVTPQQPGVRPPRQRVLPPVPNAQGQQQRPGR